MPPPSQSAQRAPAEPHSSVHRLPPREAEPAWRHLLLTWCGGIAMIAAVGALAVAAGLPTLFPPLGASAFVLLHRPEAPPAAPRSVLGGHLSGLIMGYAALCLFGIASSAPAVLNAMDWRHAGAAAFALGGTAALMELCGLPHPPAGATTIVVALGQLARPWQLGVALCAVALLVVLGGAFARLRGKRYPLWAPLRAGHP